MPNIASFDFCLFKRYWGGCHWPRHLHQFTPRSMTYLLESAGFTDVRIHYLLHTGHWALSVQNMLQSWAPTHTRLTNSRAWYYSFLLLLFVPINAVAVLFRQTGIIGFTARKPRMPTHERPGQAATIGQVSA